jgi:hypothetical protein
VVQPGHVFRSRRADVARPAAARRAAAGLASADFSPAALRDYAEAASLLRADDDQAAVLVRLAARASVTAQSRPAFYDAVRTIRSDAARMRVLRAATTAHVDTGDTARALATLDVERTLASEEERFALTVGEARRHAFDDMARLASETARADAEAAIVRGWRDPRGIDRTPLTPFTR